MHMVYKGEYVSWKMNPNLHNHYILEELDFANYVYPLPHKSNSSLKLIVLNKLYRVNA